MEGTKKLIITADDFGYCPERNRGITECYNKGGISRTSLMVNATAAKQASQMAQSINLPVGLHLNLTEGTPVSMNCDSLLGNDGFMLGKMGLREALKQGLVAKHQVREEIESQIQKFIDLIGKKPSHIDGHQHVHVLPGVREIFVDVLSAHRILQSRLPAEPGIENCHWVEPPERLQFYIQVGKDSLESKELFNRHHIRYSDSFVGKSLSGTDMTLDRAQKRILDAFELLEGENQLNATVEYMVHPGYPAKPGIGGCGPGPDEFSQDQARLNELQHLTSTEMLQFYKEHNITLTEVAS